VGKSIKYKFQAQPYPKPKALSMPWDDNKKELDECFAKAFKNATEAVNEV
jgi:hypothetical protein